MKITMDGKYTTRDGRPVRIYAVDANGIYPVVGQIEGEVDIITFTKHGIRQDGYGGTCNDLIPVKKKGWVNVYKDGTVGPRIHPSGGIAWNRDAALMSGCIDCVEIEYNAE